MNEITSIEKKPKDPKRVEAGKRLGAISKAVKEKKARERFEREASAASREEWTCPIGLGPPALGLVGIGLVGLCYLWSDRREPSAGEPVQPDVPKAEQTPQAENVRELRNLDSFD